MQEIHIKMGELEIMTKPGVILTAPSLGSCIGIGIYDRKSKIAGMAHIVLPDSSIGKMRPNQKEELPGKYADTAVSCLITKMLSLGAKKEDLIIKIAGGAQMFSLKGNSNVINIGSRNVIAVNSALKKIGLRVKNADTGGNKGRTLKLNTLNGTFYLKIIGQNEVEF